MRLALCPLPCALSGRRALSPQRFAVQRRFRFSFHRSRRHIIPHPEIHRLPQDAVIGPLAEFYLGNQRRFRPVRALVRAHASFECRSSGFERLQQLHHPVELALIEACAGLLDKDDPEDCIRRETEEETGYKISAVRKIYEAYMSPGSVTELIYFFIAEYSSAMKIHDGGGIDHEQEDIEVLEIAIDDAFKMCFD